MKTPIHDVLWLHQLPTIRRHLHRRRQHKQYGGIIPQIKCYKIRELNMDKFPRNDNNGKFNKIQDVDLWSNGSDIVQKKSNSDKKLANSKT